MVRLIKQFTPIVANSTAFEKFVGLLEQSDEERENLLRVLTYHRVDESKAQPWLDPGLISASPETFEAHMKYLAANYEVVSALDIINAFEADNQTALPSRAVAVTFDDAYHDFGQHAWPILKHYGIPVTLFVPTAFPDHPERQFWWDRVFNAIHTTEKGMLDTTLGRFPVSTNAEREQAYSRLKNQLKLLPSDVAMKEVDQICNQTDVSPRANSVLGWDSLRKLTKEGVTLGAHTRTHPTMNSITVDEMRTEIAGSREDLRREIGSDPQVFAYPSGVYNNDAIESVRQAGFALAFTTERGINEVGRADRLRLRRINVGMRTTIPLMRAQFLSWTAKFFS